MFIEVSPVNVDKPCKELINLKQVFSFVENGDTTLITIRRPKGALVEVIVK